MADYSQRVVEEMKQSNATTSGVEEPDTVDTSAPDKGTTDGISKADRWKSYLDTRKQYVECEFRTSQDFDKIMLTWPAALIAGSLTIFWHIDGTVYWMSYLYAGWFFEFLALALMLGSMVTRQLLYRQLIASHDESYHSYIDSEVHVPSDNPWKMKTQLAEWFSIGALILGAVFVFAFSISNAPSSPPSEPSTATQSKSSHSAEPTGSLLTAPETAIPETAQPETTRPTPTQPTTTQPTTTPPAITPPGSTQPGKM